MLELVCTSLEISRPGLIERVAYHNRNHTADSSRSYTLNLCPESVYKRGRCLNESPLRRDREAGDGAGLSQLDVLIVMLPSCFSTADPSDSVIVTRSGPHSC